MMPGVGVLLGVVGRRRNMEHMRLLDAATPLPDRSWKETG
jgi:hypothetical protein